MRRVCRGGNVLSPLQGRRSRVAETAPRAVRRCAPGRTQRTAYDHPSIRKCLSGRRRFVYCRGTEKMGTESKAMKRRAMRDGFFECAAAMAIALLLFLAGAKTAAAH